MKKHLDFGVRVINYKSRMSRIIITLKQGGAAFVIKTKYGQSIIKKHRYFSRTRRSNLHMHGAKRSYNCD